MMKHTIYQQLGKVDHGWLKATHHFSFANYYNPQRMGFGVLRVVNDDWVAAGAGFPAHPHKNMEIITFVRSGAISHQDNMGNTGVTHEGEVQVMSAGSGIVHSEFNRTNKPLTLYQIWIEPQTLNVTPKWGSKPFPTEANSHLPLLVSGYEEDKNTALFIHQQARIYGGVIAKGQEFEHEIAHQGYLLASAGCFEVIDNGQSITVNKGDAVEITHSTSITIISHQASELLILDVPQH